MSYLDKSKFPQCDCGLKIEDPGFEALPHFSLTGWFFITIMGTTFHPKKIDLFCQQCQKKFGSITDKRLIQYFEKFKRR